MCQFLTILLQTYIATLLQPLYIIWEIDIIFPCSFKLLSAWNGVNGPESTRNVCLINQIQKYSLFTAVQRERHHFFFCSPTRASTILYSPATSLHCYIATSLHRYLATLLHRYIATLLHRILWHTLAYSGILLHTRYIATSLHRYIISSFVPPQELPPYYALSLHCYFATSVHHFFKNLNDPPATSLHRYIATSTFQKFVGWCSKAINPIDLLFPHKSFHHTMLSRYIATSLHRSMLHC